MKLNLLPIFIITLSLVLSQGETSTSADAKAAPFMPAVNTDMNCPTIVGVWPDVFGTTDGINWSCFAVPLTPNSYAFSTGAPNVRSLTAGTAVQCTDTTKPCVMHVGLISTATLSLTSGQTNTADCVEGTTSGIGSSGGTVTGRHSNGNTGTLTIGLGLSQTVANTCDIFIPTGGWAAIRVTAGSVTIQFANDQSQG